MPSLSNLPWHRLLGYKRDRDNINYCIPNIPLPMVRRTSRHQYLGISERQVEHWLLVVRAHEMGRYEALEQYSYGRSNEYLQFECLIIVYRRPLPSSMSQAYASRQIQLPKTTTPFCNFVCEALAQPRIMSRDWE
jgi:hypothetical protein